MTALADRNRRVMAKRLRWPAGAVETCERLERKHPGWCVSWMAAWPVKGFQRRGGFYAWRAEDCPLVKDGQGGYVKRRELYGADAAAITRKMAAKAL